MRLDRLLLGLALGGVAIASPSCGGSETDPGDDGGAPSDGGGSGATTNDGGSGGADGDGGTSGTGGSSPTACDNGAENPPACDACGDGVEFFANSCADVEVPVWTPPAAEWCARPGYGLGAVADAMPLDERGPYDSWLHPENPEAAGHRKVFARLFTQFTVQNSVKWGPWAIWGSEDFAHSLVDTLEPLGPVGKGHVLAWDQQIPPLGTPAPHDVADYLEAAGFEIVDAYPTNCQQKSTLAPPATADEITAAAAAKQLLEAQVKRMAQSLGDALPIWDVVNEIIVEKCWASVFAEAGDTGVDAETRAIVTVLDWALEVHPNLIAIYNDYGQSEYAGDNPATWNRAAMTTLITAVLAEKKTLNGIGYQGHLACGPDNDAGNSDDCALDTTALQSGISEHAALGLPVYFTELDVAHSRDWANGGATKGTIDADVQAELYADYVRTALFHPDVLGITLWGYKQDVMFGAWGYSRAAGESDEGYWAKGPGFYDDHFAAKPAYHAVLDVLEEYYDGAGCDFIDGARFAKVGGGDATIAENTFGDASGVAELRELNSFALYLFNTPYPGKYAVDLSVEHDAPSPITFEVTVDGADAESITLDAGTAEGTIETLTFYEDPISLNRGARVVRVELAEETYTCSGTWADNCDGNGVIHGIRLRRVGD